ncbi:hypothetical protein ACLQ3C_07845 [Gordonia sp. DT30]|uniref:hypothetical protein n=1 Tax=Gordonia sp. DT30 TaxID=3416546 RepID=UPI003CF14C87
MSILLMALVAMVFLGVIGGAVALTVALVRSSRSQSRSAAVLHPGHTPTAPPGWALGHDPEVRLYRRMQHAMAPLYSVAITDGAFLDSRVRLELAVAQVGSQLMACSAADRSYAGAILPAIDAWITRLETVIPRILTGAPTAPTEVDELVTALPGVPLRGHET